MTFPNRAQTRPGTTRRLRLKDFDYSTPGYYFITICTHNRHKYFGTITNGSSHLSNAGQVAREVIDQIPAQFQSVSIDCSVVMPNHIHVLIGNCVRLNDSGHVNIADVIHWLKSTVHQRYRSGVRQLGWKPYDKRIWQEGFHDHIVRNDRELETLRGYVSDNEEMWDKDRFYDGFQDW